MVELNQFYMPIGSPIEENQGQIPSFRFDYLYEAGIISSAKIQRASIGTAQIGTISFSQIKGGTAVLGGISDGDGLLTVNNAGGTEVVRLDNNGITITAGTISNVTQTNGTITSGTINNSAIGTPRITGGTASAILIGTSTVTGGTVNPLSYKFGGTAGVTGTFTYLTSGTIAGTIVSLGGIITTIS